MAGEAWTEGSCVVQNSNVGPQQPKWGINQGRCYTESNAILRTQLQLHVLFNFLIAIRRLSSHPRLSCLRARGYHCLLQVESLCNS